MPKYFRRMVCSSLAAIIVAGVMLSSTMQAVAQKPGKGGGDTDPPPPAPLPNMRYELKFFDLPPNGVPEQSIAVGKMNIHGEYVGNYLHANGLRSAYLHVNGVSVDLNDLGVVGLPDDLAFRSAFGINDHGIIVGRLVRKGFSIEESVAAGIPTRGYVLDILATPAVVHLLPDESFGLSTYARFINNEGDIVGTIDGGGAYIYNTGLLESPDEGAEIVPFGPIALTNRGLFSPAKALVYDGNSPGVYTLGGQIDYFNVAPQYSVRPSHINDSGLMAGTVAVKVQTSRNKYRTDYYAARMTLTSVELLPGTELDNDVQGFNNSGDMAISGNRTVQFIDRDDWGLVEVSNLIVGNATDLNLWATAVGRRFRSLADRIDIPGSNERAGRLCGVCTYETGPVRYFILTPVAVPQQ